MNTSNPNPTFRNRAKSFLVSLTQTVVTRVVTKVVLISVLVMLGLN